MSDFLYSLGQKIASQFGDGNTTRNAEDKVADGVFGATGGMGGISGQFDRTAERRYLEEGFTAYSRSPKVFEILMAQPDVTVVIKKKEFASLSQNNIPEFKDEQDSFFMTASSILFQNKCDQFATYERLSKLDTITSQSNQVDYGVLPTLLSLYDTANGIGGLFNGGGSIFSASFTNAMTLIRDIVAFSQPQQTTTWTTDPNALYQNTYGTGTGVMELTTVSRVNTDVALKWGGGGFSFTLEDPYGLSIVTPNDIEVAISAAFNIFNQSSAVKTARSLAQTQVTSNQNLLNQLRTSRGANIINFIINPASFPGNRVTLTIDGLGFEIQYNAPLSFAPSAILSGSNITLDASALFGSAELGNQGVNGQEQNYIQSILNLMDSLFSLDSSTQGQLRSDNAKSNYVRNKMTLHYGDKPFISAQDSVHIYMMSRNLVDRRVANGLDESFDPTSAFNLQGQMSQGLADLSTQINTAFNPDNNSVQIEKAAFVGNDFPDYLWQLVRNQFVTDKAGTHVFAGLVGQVTKGWGSGKFTVNVTGYDNTKYFDLSVVNENPALTNFNGPIYDPLTPFELHLDTVSGKQNQPPQLLGENQTFVQQMMPRYTSGPYQGQIVTQANFVHQDSDNQPVASGSLSQVYYMPNGMRYRWKEGIASLTFTKNSYSNDFNTSIPSQNVPKLTTDAFSGQDIMNVLSLLVTGQAYNFATFYQTLIKQAGALSPGADFFKDPNFYNQLLSNIKKNNSLWGNFQPFKSMNMSDQANAQQMMGYSNVVQQTSNLQSLLSQRANIFDQLTKASGAGLSSAGTQPNNVASTTAATSSTALLQQQLNGLDANIQQLQTNLNSSYQSNNVLVIGNDVSFDNNSSAGTQDPASTLTDPNVRRDLRRKTNFLARRLFYRVKANQDQNYFIVDNTYDNDMDIQAFAKAIGNDFSLFANEYDVVGHQIQAVAEKLDLEVYADTQGHIQARVPQYNRVPNSVFLNMLRYKETTGIQIFPQFLQNLYSNQVTAAIQTIETMENQIRLYALALGISNDNDIIYKLNLPIGEFAFLSNSQTCKITNIDLLKVFTNPDDQSVSNLASFSDNVADQASNVQFAFTTATQANLIVKKFNAGVGNPKNIPIANSNDPALTSRYTTVSNAIFADTGIAPANLQSLFPTSTGGVASAADVLSITNQIAKAISSRQIQIKSASALLDTLTAAAQNQISPNDPLNTLDANTIAFPGLYDGNVPDVLEHMIEDETYDDYGPGSGSRYIIKANQIIGYSITETPPQFNFVQVNGIFAQGEGLDLLTGPNGLNLPGGGNTLTTAYAADYDLWRMYGFRAANAVNVPFLSDPDTQLAPYAVSLLNRARGQILNGTITIAGNEFMQVGEVVFIEPENMLYYVEKVSHSFEFGGKFTTTLKLSYGHHAGHYIPTAFDTIGKVMFKNRQNMNHVVLRNVNSQSEQNIGAIVIPTTKPATSLQDCLNDDKYGNANQYAITNIAQVAYGLLGSQSNSKLEIRTYYYDTNEPASGTLQTIANQLKAALTTKQGSSGSVLAPSNSNVQINALPANQVSVISSLDMVSPTTTKGPSDKAWTYALNLAGPGASTKAIQVQLTEGVIDLWITYNNPATTAQGSTQAPSGQ
jgi:hypothetical protein